MLDGRVLVTGGGGLGTVTGATEVFDPASGTWTPTAPSGPRIGHSATLLQNGKVLVAGGTPDPQDDFIIAHTEMYDPTTGAWTSAGSLIVPTTNHAAATTLDGDAVVVIGGFGGTSSLDVTEVFDPKVGAWTLAERLNIGRGDATVTLLPDGNLLVVGGMNANFRLATGCCTNVATAELYDVGKGRWLAAGILQTARNGHTATLLQDGRVLVAGGWVGAQDEHWTATDTAELYESDAFRDGAPRIAGLTGVWYNPTQSGHGFMLEVLPGAPMQLLASWSVFAPQGGQSWIIGLGPINGNRAVVLGSQIAGAGARFPPNFDPANVRQESWGTLTFTFSDCDHGHVDWVATAPGYGSGGMDLVRLTLPAGLTCQQ